MIVYFRELLIYKLIFLEVRGVGIYLKMYLGMFGLKFIFLLLIILVFEIFIMLNLKFNLFNR